MRACASRSVASRSASMSPAMRTPRVSHREVGPRGEPLARRRLNNTAAHDFPAARGMLIRRVVSDPDRRVNRVIGIVSTRKSRECPGSNFARVRCAARPTLHTSALSRSPRRKEAESVRRRVPLLDTYDGIRMRKLL